MAQIRWDNIALPTNSGRAAAAIVENSKNLLSPLSNALDRFDVSSKAKAEEDFTTARNALIDSATEASKTATLDSGDILAGKRTYRDLLQQGGVSGDTLSDLVSKYDANGLISGTLNKTKADNTNAALLNLGNDSINNRADINTAINIANEDAGGANFIDQDVLKSTLERKLENKRKDLTYAQQQADIARTLKKQTEEDAADIGIKGREKVDRMNKSLQIELDKRKGLFDVTLSEYQNKLKKLSTTPIADVYMKQGAAAGKDGTIIDKVEKVVGSRDIGKLTSYIKDQLGVTNVDPNKLYGAIAQAFDLTRTQNNGILDNTVSDAFLKNVTNSLAGSSERANVMKQISDLKRNYFESTSELKYKNLDNVAELSRVLREDKKADTSHIGTDYSTSPTEEPSSALDKSFDKFGSGENSTDPQDNPEVNTTSTDETNSRVKELEAILAKARDNQSLKDKITSTDFREPVSKNAVIDPNLLRDLNILGKGVGNLISKGDIGSLILSRLTNTPKNVKDVAVSSEALLRKLLDTDARYGRQN